LLSCAFTARARRFYTSQNVNSAYRGLALVQSCPAGAQRDQFRFYRMFMNLRRAAFTQQTGCQTNLSFKRMIQFAIIDFWPPLGAPARKCFGCVKPASQRDTKLYQCQPPCKTGAMRPPTANLLITRGAGHSINSDGGARRDILSPR